jgi:tetratricopeptide (TPR) repeat protein
VLDGSDLEMAFARADRAVALGAAGAVLGEARLIQARARSWQGALAEALAFAEQAAGLLAGDDPAWFHAVGEAVACSARLGDADRLHRWTDELIATPDVASARQAQIVSLCRTMVPLTNVGSFGPAERVLHRLDAAAGEAPSLGAYASAQMAEARGIYLGLRGELGPFVECLRAAVRGYEQAGAMRDAATALASLAWGLLHVGQADVAAESIRRALELAERLALSHVRTWAMFQSARVAALRGQRSEACARMGEVADVYAAQASRRQEGMARAELARMLADAGDAMAAEAEAERACELLAHAPALRPLASAMHALSLAALGRVDQARALAEEASAIEVALGTFLFGGTVDLALVTSLVASGDVGAAGATSEAGRTRLLARAERLPQELRASFLALPHHARLLAFTRAPTAG